MKSTILKPYPGIVYVTNNKDEYENYHLKLFGTKDTISDNTGGRVSMETDTVYLVYTNSIHSLVHELTHVVFHLFEHLGINPSDSGGEAFCYLLTHLFEEFKLLFIQEEETKK